MSSFEFEEEGQPGPATEVEEGPSEPRLLTRPALDGVPTRPIREKRPLSSATEASLRAWAVRLRPRQKIGSGYSPGPSPIRRRRARWFAWVAGVSLALVLVTALVMVLDLRHALKAALPQVDGAIHIAGLHAPVIVTRDAHGVPSITAANLDDLLFAQGYVTASDRLWQMDGLRRHAAGQLAEILGPGLIEHDRRQRYLQVRAAADRAVAQLPPDQLAQLDAYARGVNTFIDTHRGTLPMEFRLLAYKPTPWSARDSLLVSLAMYQDLSTGFPGKLNREVLSAHLPADLLPDLYPVGSWRDQPPAAQSRSITAPHDVEQIPLDPSQSRLGSPGRPGEQMKPNELLAVSDSLAGANRCDGCRSGSNDWVVSGAHTASGGPLVSNDMHLNLGIPDIWYEAGLHADLVATGAVGDRLDVVGFTLPGVPFVIVGRNAHVAWGVTNLGGDVEDLRVEHLRGTGENTEYQRPDQSWLPVNHRPERIKVRGGRDVTLDVLTTTHAVGNGEHAVGNGEMETPIISPLYRSERRALSLAWTAYDPAAVTSPFLNINTAADGTSLVAAFAGFGGPTLNLVWGDDRNNIGYHAIGRIPVRGAAVQHLRSLPVAAPNTVPPGIPLPTDGDGEGESGTEPDSPQALIEGSGTPFSSRPHLVLSSFPVRRRRAAAATKRPSHVRSGRYAVRSQTRPELQPDVPPPAAEPLVAAQAPLNYTVGSPVSPLPVDALDASQAWSGYIGYSDLPAVTNPANGFLATANARITPDDYPWAVTDDWTDPFRTERIVHLLSGRNGLTPADMLRMQNDVHSDVNQAIGQRLAYALDHASAASLGGDSKRLKQAADLLRNWNGDMTVGSPAAAIVTAARQAIWPSLLIPQLQAHDGAGVTLKQAASLAQLYSWGERSTALELLLQNQPARWLPHGYAHWSDFLAVVVERGLVGSGAPGDLRGWQYGQLHTVEIAHPILGEEHLLSDLLGVRGTTGAQPAPGDATTIKQIGAHFGPSERFTADLGSRSGTPGAAFANITTGESEDGRSPWYLDQLRPWMDGTTFPLPLGATESTHTLRLLP